MPLDVLTFALALACAWLLWRELRRQWVQRSRGPDSTGDGPEFTALLRESIEWLSEGFALFDSEDRLVLCNERFRQLHALDPETTKPGQSFEEILKNGLAREAFPQAIGQEAQWLSQRLERHRAGGLPTEQQSADGGWTLAFEKWTAGGCKASVLVDISDVKQREADLILAERGLLEVLESMQEGFALLDENDRLMMWNERYVEMFPVIRDCIKKGALFEDLIRAAADRQQNVEALKDKEAWIQERMEAHRRHDMGSEHQFRDGRWVLLRNYRGVYGRSLKVFLDITEIKKREAQLREATLQAEAANRIKSEFLANMSHELRTPLNAIIGFSDILISEKSGPLGAPAYKEYAQDINDGGHRLLSIIEDIMDLSRLETGKVDLRETEISLANLLELCQRAYEDKAVSAGVSFESIPPAPDIEFWGDQVRLRQILHNLVSNAIKFTPSGGGVLLEASRHASGEVLLRVTDSGIGMTQTEAQFALEPFRQAEPSLARRHDGSGIGLTLCQALVNLHGGSVEIVSEKGNGTTVTVRLPANRVIEMSASTQAAGD